ncbi:MAG: hypothetical protein HWD59_09500 [Coxiellaceae bacterium]|nr:MAG: hypothetical protein HWD59_09500 [Coxiellaceae bacterium]
MAEKQCSSLTSFAFPDYFEDSNHNGVDLHTVNSSNYVLFRNHNPRNDARNTDFLLRVLRSHPAMKTFDVALGIYAGYLDILSDELLLKEFHHIENIKLDLTNNLHANRPSITPLELKGFIEKLRNMSQLKALCLALDETFAGFNGFDGNVKLIADAISCVDQIEIFRLDVINKEFPDSFKKLTPFTFEMQFKLLWEILKIHTGIKTLEIREISLQFALALQEKLSNEDCSLTTLIVGYHAEDKELDEEILTILTNLPRITKLGFQISSINDSNIHLLGHVLKYNSHLTSLSLKGNIIGPEVLEAFVKQLFEDNFTLEEIILPDNATSVTEELVKK